MNQILRVLVTLVCFVAWGTAMAEIVPPAPDAPRYSTSLWPMVAVRPALAPLPQQPMPHLFDYALYGSIAGYRALDYLSTRRALAAGAHEVVLPQWVVNDRGTFAAFEGVATAAEVGGSVWLIRHRHRRMARAINLLSIGVGVQAVVHNYRQQSGSPSATPGP